MGDLIEAKLEDILIASDQDLWNFDREQSVSKMIGSTVDNEQMKMKTIFNTTNEDAKKGENDIERRNRKTATDQDEG